MPHRLFAKYMQALKTHDKRPLQRIMLKNGKAFLDGFIRVVVPFLDKNFRALNVWEARSF